MNLIDKFIPLFQTIGSVEILLAEDSDKSFLDLEQEMNALLSSVSVSEYSVSQNADAMFAACALIDELILGSQWKCKDEWARSPLQKRHFDTNNAGTEFYQRLDQLNPSDPKDQHVREVYLYALVAGFSGCYFEAGEESLKQDIIQSNYALLSTSVTTSPFSQEVPERLNNGSKQVNRKRQKELAVMAGPILFVVITYLALRNDLINTVSQVLNQL